MVHTSFGITVSVINFRFNRCNTDFKNSILLLENPLLPTLKRIQIWIIPLGSRSTSDSSQTQSPKIKSDRFSKKYVSALIFWFFHTDLVEAFNTVPCMMPLSHDWNFFSTKMYIREAQSRFTQCRYSRSFVFERLSSIVSMHNAGKFVCLY